MEPRYQCVALGSIWSWRLLGSNHRELARAASGFPTFEEAAADAATTSAQARSSTIEITLRADSTWHWEMTADGTVRAASAVGYARRLECARAVERFRGCAPSAPISPTPLIHRRLGSRAQRAGPESWSDDPSRFPRAPRPR
jgi:uncharacterized protein YegP (UPF0339 family)